MILELQRDSGVSLARQIYLVLRDKMLEGSLKEGEALLSTREMAKQLAVSRNTVSEAYEMLSAEGYILSRQGAPTRVANGLQLEKTRSSLEREKVNTPAYECLADFRTGQPDLRRFPKQLWLQLVYKAAVNSATEEWGYSTPQGLLALREEISAWLLRSRGIKTYPEDIFITAGATQALHLLTYLIAGRGREILVEDPCHTGMRRVLEQQGFAIRPVLVDEQGIQTHHLNGEDICAAYVTPSHQFPLGGILPADRRAALLRFARKKEIYVIEDDYDSEFRYGGLPVAPLYSMDQEWVIYVGTFSKILFPALRIGYVILPRELHARWKYLRMHADVQNPPFEQVALAEYMQTRKFDRHIQKMRRLYGQRRNILLASLRQEFGEEWRVWGEAAGLHLAFEFPGKCFDRQFMLHARNHGLLVTPVEYHSIQKGVHQDKLLLGYGHLESEQIRNGIQLLNEFMVQYKPI